MPPPAATATSALPPLPPPRRRRRRRAPGGTAVATTLLPMLSERKMPPIPVNCLGVPSGQGVRAAEGGGGRAAAGGTFPPATGAPAVTGKWGRHRHWPQPRLPNTFAACGAVWQRRRLGRACLLDGWRVPLWCWRGGGRGRLCRGVGRRGGGAACRDRQEWWRRWRGWALPGFLPACGADGGAGGGGGGGGGEETPGRRPSPVWASHERLAVYLVCVGVIHPHHLTRHGECGQDATVPALSPRRSTVAHLLFGDQHARAGGRRWCYGTRGAGRMCHWWRWSPAGARRGAAVVFGACERHVGAGGSCG